jgi:hypothetical protein
MAVPGVSGFCESQAASGSSPAGSLARTAALGARSATVFRSPDLIAEKKRVADR